jgi:hypothetical protein
MLAPLAIGGEWELVGDALAIAVGEEGIVALAGGQAALGEAEHDDDVELEPEGETDRPDEDAVAEAASAPEVGIELEGEGAGEAGEVGPRCHRVEVGEAVECGIDLGRRLLLLGGPGSALLLAAE